MASLFLEGILSFVTAQQKAEMLTANCQEGLTRNYKQINLLF